MKETNVRKAANHLWKLWKEHETIESLPEPLKPISRAEGYAIQACLEERSEEPIFGWKIAATSDAGQSHIGVSGPMAGRLLKERVYSDGDVISVDKSLMKVAEAEFAFRIAADLPPKGNPYSVEEVLKAVSHLHPSIEIPDSRFKNFASAGEAQLIADNACAHEFVLGPPSDEIWRTLDLKTHAVELKTTKPATESGKGGNVLGDPRIALTWLVNELCQFGMYVKQNQVITTGTTTQPITIEKGMDVSAKFGVLGSVSARL